MFIKQSWLKILLFIPIVLFRKISLIFSGVRNDMPVAELFMQNMFSGNPSRQYTNVTIVMFGMVEIILFSLLFGVYIYKDLFGSGIYIITRQRSRIKWFFRRCAELLMSAALFSIMFVGTTFIISVNCSKHGVDPLAVKLFLLTGVLVTLFAFWQTLMINLTAIRLGSTIGFVVNYIALTLLSLLAVSHEKIPVLNGLPLLLRLNPVANVTINWAAEWGETIMPVVYFIALSVLTMLIGMRRVENMDISLQNNENAA